MNTAVMPTYGRADIAFEKGEGVYLISTDGRRFRFLLWDRCKRTRPLSPKTCKSFAESGRHALHTSNPSHSAADGVGRTSVWDIFADLGLFGNSGAEAVEGCIKLARKYQSDRAPRKMACRMLGLFPWPFFCDLVGVEECETPRWFRS